MITEYLAKLAETTGVEIVILIAMIIGLAVGMALIYCFLKGLKLRAHADPQSHFWLALVCILVGITMLFVPGTPGWAAIFLTLLTAVIMMPKGKKGRDK